MIHFAIVAFANITGSTTERREIRNFPYPSVFELTGCQRLTVKRGIRNVGQFLAAEVTNPGQNESQQMFALCDRMDKEGDILDRDSSPNESPDRVKEEERGRMIGQNPKTEVAPFSSAEIGINNLVYRTEVAVNGRANLMPNSRRRSRAGFQDNSWSDRMYGNCRRNSGEKRKESWTRRWQTPSSQAI